MAEISTHGGTFITDRIFHLIIENGARPALAGEFTLRAFVHGKIDLTQAEAINDVINARNNQFLKSAIKSLSGQLGSQIRDFREQLVKLLAHLEVTFEYPEEDIPDVPRQFILDEVDFLIDSISNLTKSYKPDSQVNRAPVFVLIGRPNVGKSSLLNQLLGYKRAIINESPGTTRDLIGETFRASGMDVLLVDTAGIVDTKNTVEAEGIAAALDFAHEKADAVLLILNNAEPLQVKDIDLLNSFVRLNKGFIIVLNKFDLPAQLDESQIPVTVPDIIRVSALTGCNIDELKECIDKIASESLECSSEVILTNQRHKNLLEQAVLSLREVINNIELPQDVLTIDLKSALESLSEITGENATEDVLKNIFSSFCIGK